jgi:hypothetical protein
LSCSARETATGSRRIAGNRWIENSIVTCMKPLSGAPDTRDPRQRVTWEHRAKSQARAAGEG